MTRVRVPITRRTMIAFALVCSASAALAQVDRQDGSRAPGAAPDAAYARGTERFERGLALAKSDPAQAQSLFREAAATWRTLAHDSGIRSAELESNIGNAFSLAQDPARAIAAYRRALRLDPTDRVAQSGLAAMLARCGIADHERHASLLEQALTWLAVRQRPWLVWGFAGTYAAGWTVLLLRQGGARWPSRGVGVGLLLASAKLIAPVIGHEALYGASDEAVVVSAGVIARQGPSDGAYEPAFKEPVPAGLTVHVQERRGEWSRVALPDGRGAWLPASALEAISN
ncbi:MAG: hypothetical protein JNM80_04195 [Phycisphaerae bacterium]|nr:hypothetical protein [Phycisphaerae bacterium]